MQYNIRDHLMQAIEEGLLDANDVALMFIKAASWEDIYDVLILNEISLRELCEYQPLKTGREI